MFHMVWQKSGKTAHLSQETDDYGYGSLFKELAGTKNSKGYPGSEKGREFRNGSSRVFQVF